MIGRLSILAIGLVSGSCGFLGGLGPVGISQPATALSSGASHDPASAPEPDAAAGSKEQGMAKLSAEAIEAAGIDVAAVQSGTIARRITVPGTIVPEADRIAHVAVKLSSIVAELRKNIGDAVEKNEVLAVLESREVADAKSEYLAARLTNELQQDLFERDKALWDKKVSSEQQFLRSRNEAARAKMRNDIARQKLFALGLTETEIAGLPDQPEAFLRRQEVRSPISGHVVERKVELGVAVGRDNLETELFVIADLDRVWVELAVSPEDVPLVRIGQTVSVAARGTRGKGEGQADIHRADVGQGHPLSARGSRDRQSRRCLASRLVRYRRNRSRRTVSSGRRAGRRHSDHGRRTGRIRPDIGRISETAGRPWPKGRTCRRGRLGP